MPYIGQRRCPVAQPPSTRSWPTIDLAVSSPARQNDGIFNCKATTKTIVVLTEPEAYEMANRQQRSNREKKKPKADKNKNKSTAPASPFALARSPTPPPSSHTAKRTA
jgi:hypothetical protein